MPRRPKLTDIAVVKLKPKGGKRTDYADGLIPGLVLRVSPDGSRAFSLVYRVAGDPKHRRLTLGTYPTLKLGPAREAARNALLQAKAGDDPAAAKKTAITAKRVAEANTLERAVDQFIERGLKGKNRAARYVAEVRRNFENHVYPAWERTRSVASITRRDVTALLDGIVDEGKPIAANRTLAAVRAMLNWAVRRGIIDANPATLVERPGAETRRERTLSAEEVNALWPHFKALGYPFGPYFQIALLTGQRRAEVAGMRWRDIDEGEGTWTLPSDMTKAGRSHIVPLSSLAIDILSACKAELVRKREPEEKSLGTYVLTTRNDRPISGYSKAKADLDTMVAKARTADELPPIAPWTIHDLRRTVGTGLGKLGISRFVISRVLNHADNSVTGIYDRHEYLAEKRHALDLWSQYLAGIVNPHAANVLSFKTPAL